MSKDLLSYGPVAAYLNKILRIFILTYFLLDGFCQVKAMNDVEQFSKSSVICLHTTKKISADQTYTILTLTDIPWDIVGSGYPYSLSLSLSSSGTCCSYPPTPLLEYIPSFLGNSVHQISFSSVGIMSHSFC